MTPRPAAGRSTMLLALAAITVSALLIRVHRLDAFYDLTVRPIPPLSAMLRNQLGLETGQVLGRWVWFAVLLGALVWAGAGAERERRGAIHTLVAAYALPIALLSALSLMVRPVLIQRVLIVVVVPVALLLGSLGDSRWRLLRRLGLPALAAVLALGTFYHYRGDQKEPWREVSQYLQEAVQPGDTLVFNASRLPHEARTAPFLLDRYDPRRRLEHIRRLLLGEVVAPCGLAPEPCLNAEVAREWAGVVLERASYTGLAPAAGQSASTACG
ncbi:MAG: hypothetical protein HYV93_18825 [Candidatus Rokubacteria bacterium]|nr:hypothetical protein [Candidatus Rokubacteria bacterium]